MQRALWTAATGMTSQQVNVDTIANNLSNVNTIGFKGDKAEFKSLLYQTIQSETTSANGENKPVGAQVGLGSRLASTTTSFSQGPLLANDSDTAFGLNGVGFFAVMDGTGETLYTRNGDFHWAMGVDGVTLSTSDGYPVLDSEGQPIVLPEGVHASSTMWTVNTGELGYLDASGNYISLNHKLGTYQFRNPSGLEKRGGTRFAVTEASGEPVNEMTLDEDSRSEIRHKYLEGSNVNVADEMVNLIVAQRAYEMNSKAIQAADEMLGQANSLKR